MSFKTTRRVLSTVAIATTLVVVTAIGANAAPAQASRVPCLNNGTPQFVVWNYNYTGELCFSGAGGTSVKVYDVDEIDTGDDFGAYIVGGSEYAFDQREDPTWTNNPELTWFTLNPLG